MRPPVRSHQRIYLAGPPWDTPAAAPAGLWRLQRRCPADPDALRQAGVALEVRGPSQQIELFASVVLTAEGWQPLAEGEVIAV